ncbi:MAG TPA: efflux RND transporter periplasmic adaptor subunit [Planctomycetaceae bacterium]|jgi:cobalt-zinc-cadmium efflux system membrane fusion protein
MTRHARTPSAVWNRARRTLAACLISAGCSLVFLAAGCDSHSAKKSAASAESTQADATSVDVPQKVADMTGLKTAVASLPTKPRELELRGSLALDVNRLVHVHARFPGQIVHLEMIEEPEPGSSTGAGTKRTLNFMDHVTKGQKLGQIWSKELGEKKSELVDALVRLRIDTRNLAFLRDLLAKGGTADKTVREGERLVEVGGIAVTKAERTLRSWTLTEKEIQAVRDEASRIHSGGARDFQQDETWATVEVISPIDGTIVEKNVVEGDLVNADSDLFKIADLSQLSAWARVYEEDLPILHRMPKPLKWKLKLSSDPQAAITGTVDRIGEIIDPNEHMALLAGLVQNPNGQLHAGQFITAIIDLPREQDVVEIPTRALVEDGDESVVFVQPDPQVLHFKMRRVSVVRRTHNFVYVRSRLTPDQLKEGLEELHEGEHVMAAGALEQKAALQEQHGQ